MANYDFDKVTYDYYADTMGRSFIPSEADFNNYKLEAVQFVKRLLPFITEFEKDGVIKSACLCVEVNYLEARAVAGEGLAVSSESVGGHSVSYDGTERALNAKSSDAKKIEKIKLFNVLNTGVC